MQDPGLREREREREGITKSIRLNQFETRILLSTDALSLLLQRIAKYDFKIILLMCKCDFGNFF